MVLSSAPLVSIITPVCNGSQYLEELIQSVQSQNYPKIEHIIIDDGSHDNGATVSVLRKHPHLRWWSQRNKGQYATMNEGLLAAKGELVCFVSADDVILPGAVSAVVEFLSKHPDYDGTFGTTGRIDPEGKTVPYFIPFQTAPISFYPYFAHISHCSLYVNRDALKRHDLVFDPLLSYVGDYDWIIRIRKTRLRIGLVKRQLASVRFHTDQTSRRYSNDSRVETEKVIARHQINKLSFGILNTLYRLLFKAWYATQLIRNGETTMFIKQQMNKYNSK